MDNYIGYYPLCNTGAILLHDVDYVEDKVLVSLNGRDKKWTDLIEEQDHDVNDAPVFVTGFHWGEMFIPLNEVMRA